MKSKFEAGSGALEPGGVPASRSDRETFCMGPTVGGVLVIERSLRYRVEIVETNDKAKSLSFKSIEVYPSIFSNKTQRPSAALSGVRIPNSFSEWLN